MKFQVHYKEKFYFITMICISFLIYLAILLSLRITFYRAAIYALIIGVFALLHAVGTLFLVGYLKGNAIKINHKQFPDIFAILESHAKQLNFKKTPQIYVLQGGGILNAFATRFLTQDYVVLYSDVLEMAYQEGLDAVSFIIGHELGHIKRNHTGFLNALFTLPAKLFIPFLGNAYSRAREYTCDNIGYNLCPQGALKGMLLLGAGKKLYAKIDVQELISTYKYEKSTALRFTEIFSTHPAFIKRIEIMYTLNRDNLTSDVSPYISPHVIIDQVKSAE